MVKLVSIRLLHLMHRATSICRLQYRPEPVTISNDFKKLRSNQDSLLYVPSLKSIMILGEFVVYIILLKKQRLLSSGSQL